MCGSTSAQTGVLDQQNQTSAAEMDFYKTLSNEYSTVFGEDQGILQNLNQNLTPIINAGPSQQGFSPSEVNSLNTQSTEQTGAGYAKAQQAVQEDTAAAGGGNDYLPSGGTTQLEGDLAGTATAEDASEKNQINLANYSQGNTNFNNAVGAQEGVASQLSAGNFAGAVTSAGNGAAGSEAGAGATANQIAQQANSTWTSVIGALGGIAGTAAGGWTSHH